MAVIKFSNKSWVASENGLVLKSVMIDSTTAVTKATEVDANGISHTVAKSGSVYADAVNGVYGLIYEDKDVTGGAAIGSIVIAGHFDDEKLPASAAEYAANFAATGLFPVKAYPVEEIIDDNQ